MPLTKVVLLWTPYASAYYASEEEGGGIWRGDICKQHQAKRLQNTWVIPTFIQVRVLQTTTKFLNDLDRIKIAAALQYTCCYVSSLEIISHA